MATIRLFRHYLRVPLVLLALIEGLTFIAAVYLSAYIRFWGNFQDIQEHIGPLPQRAILVACVMFLSMTAMGLYQTQRRERLSDFVLRMGASYLLGTVVLSSIFYLFPYLFFGRGALALTMVISLLGITLIRSIYFYIAQDIFKHRALILGAGERAYSVAELHRSSDQRGFTVVGFVRVQGENEKVDADSIIELDRPLVEYALDHEIDEIIVAVDDRRKNFPLDELLDCRMRGIDILDLLTFYEREAGKIRLDLLHASWLVFSDGFRHSTLREFTKRSFDILVSLQLALLTLPLMVLTTLAILIESGWRQPIFYRQIRVGQNGRPFPVLKFRSMRTDAELDGPRWAEKNDSRVTRVGRFIRKARIDELPQLLNVLRGDMSFVGPRPERPEFVVDLSEKINYYSERHYVKPGLTGWAQLRYPYGANEKDAVEKLQYDLYYVKNHSLFLDLGILLQTCAVVFFGQGAR